ncbi:MAG: hypothetical protein JXR76_31470 [Deltaproteobacteria bacterium]|nr:hypothetical protein [Deltaproteobacteria bacterium]
MRHHFAALLVVFAFIAGPGCSGKGGEVAAVVATGATLKAVQVAREKKSPQRLSASSQGDCCVVCGECTFPCGNRCVANGTLCTRPKGCACTADESVPEGTPRPEPNPIDCNQHGMYTIEP